MRIHLLKRNTPLLKNAPKKSFRSFSLPANSLFIGFSADILMRWDPSTTQFFLSAVVNKCIKVNPNPDKEPNNTAWLTLPRWKIFSGWGILSCISFSWKADEQGVCGEAETSERKIRCFAMYIQYEWKSIKMSCCFSTRNRRFFEASVVRMKHVLWWDATHTNVWHYTY